MAAAAAVAAAADKDAAASPDSPVLFGVGYHSEWLADLREAPAEVGCVEIIADDFLGAPPARRAEVECLRGLYPVLPHLIHPAPGNAAPPDRATVDAVAQLVERLQPPWISFHLAFTGSPGRPLGHLATLPFTREAAATAVRNLRAWSAALGMPVIVENVTCGVTLPGEMDEAEFLCRVLEGAEAGLLLDLHNVHTNAVNEGSCAGDFLERLPLDRVTQLHLGGGHEEDGYRIDSHAAACPREVWDLLEWVAGRVRPRAVTLEWDTRRPAFSVIREELARAAGCFRGTADGAA